MAMSRKRVETDFDRLVDDAERPAGDPVDDHLDELLARVEAKHDDTVDEPKSTDASEPTANTEATGEAKPQTVEELLDQIDAKSKSEVDKAIKADERKVTQNVNSFILTKTRKSTKKYSGYLAFCLTVMAIGAVWAGVGIATGSQWPIPWFGWWNVGCGGFLVVWGGMLLLDLR